VNRLTVAAIVGVACVIVVFAVGLVVAAFLAVLSIVDRTDAHVCGLAAVQRSAIAHQLLGTPIVQKGFTGGRSSQTNGELYERMTFNVTGPLGEAFVLSQGSRSPLGSHLSVRIGRDQRSWTVYSGPFDCPELHQKR
jgi:hypothetical protein